MAAALLAAVSTAGIYPDGHWDVATKLTPTNFGPVVKESVDAGKTLFAFANNSKVAFGDVNLAEDQVRDCLGCGEPGSGGWPTIRVFNQHTGYEGKFAGDWKDANGLDGAMCDVFGDEATLQSYVEEMGNVLLCTDIACLCSRKEGGACAKKELDYHAKFEGESMEVIQSRLKLLSGSLAKSGKADAWMSQRIAVLKLLAATKAAADKEEL